LYNILKRKRKNTILKIKKQPSVYHEKNLGLGLGLKKTMSPCFDFVIRFRKGKDIVYTAYVSMYLCMRQIGAV